MGSFRKTAPLLGALAAAAATAACAGDLGAEPGGSARPSIGAAAQAISDDGWRLVEALDFNFDGMQDVIWNNPGKNLTSVTLLNGSHLLAQGPNIPGPLGEGWVVTTAADFNGDGMADVFWTNEDQSLMVIWLMDGVQVLAKGAPFPTPGRGWLPDTGAGDMNFDGMSDVVWYNPGRSVMSVWLMDGTALLDAGPEIPAPIGPGWEGITVADFNFDGMVDVIWNNSARNVMSISLMKGTQLLAAGPEIPGPAGKDWSVRMAADFNADGMSDVIWGNDTTSEMAIYLMNGSHLLAPGPALPSPPGRGWSVRTAGDTNFDGMADGIWQVTGTNRMAVYLMNGDQLLAPGAEFPGPDGG